MQKGKELRGEKGWAETWRCSRVGRVSEQPGTSIFVCDHNTGRVNYQEEYFTYTALEAELRHLQHFELQATTVVVL